MGRFEAVQGVVYDREQDAVVRDVNRAYPHVAEHLRVKMAQYVAMSRNMMERDLREIELLVRCNTGVL